MRRVTVGCALMLPLAACGSAERSAPISTPTPGATVAARASPVPESIAVERWGNMGGGRSEWVIEQGGAVRMAWDEPGDVRTHRRRFTAGPAAFAEIRVALARLEARQGKPLEKIACMTDSPGSAVTWRYGKRKVVLLIDNTCSDAEGDANVAQLDAIGLRLAALAKSAPDLKQTAEQP